MNISIGSFLMYFALTVLGAYRHYLVVCKSGRHMGSLWDYLVSDYPGKSMKVGVALLGYSLAMAASGTADFINPELVWETLKAGQIPLASIPLATLAIQSGYHFDSEFNKGSNE